MKKNGIIFIIFCLVVTHLYSQDAIIQQKEVSKNSNISSNSNVNKENVTIHSKSHSDGKYLISMESNDQELEIYYTIEGSEPTTDAIKYKNPFLVNVASMIKANTFKDGEVFGKMVQMNICISTNKKVYLKEEPDGNLKAKGGSTLTDGVNGTLNYNDGKWLGFEGKDMEAVIDLEKERNLKTISIYYQVCIKDRIFEPIGFIIEVSEDGINYTKISSKEADPEKWKNEVNLKVFDASFLPTKGRYVRITVKNRGICPSGYTYVGSKSWILIDEITVNEFDFPKSIKIKQF